MKKIIIFSGQQEDINLGQRKFLFAATTKNISLMANLLKRFGFLKIARRDFYECGFKPQTQKPIRLPIQFLLICVFFLLYDIELVFLFPYVSGVVFSGFYDFILLIFFFTLFFFYFYNLIQKNFQL